MTFKSVSRAAGNAVVPTLVVVLLTMLVWYGFHVAMEAAGVFPGWSETHENRIGLPYTIFGLITTLVGITTVTEHEYRD